MITRSRRRKQFEEEGLIFLQELVKEKQIFNQGSIIMSLQRMKKNLRKSQFDKFLQYMNDIFDNDQYWPQNILYHVPYRFLTYVEEYRGNKYSLRFSTKYWEQKFHQQQLISTIQIPQSLSVIGHIRFPNLLELNLSHNSINNIEALIFIDAPFIQQIDISYNNIVNLNILSKVNFPKIQKLIFCYNQLTQVEKLNRIKAPVLNGTFLNPFDTIATYKTHRILDFRFLFKMQSSIQNTIGKFNLKKVNFREKPFKGQINQPAITLHQPKKISRMSAPFTTGIRRPRRRI